MKQIDIYCSMCDATFKIQDDLEYPYRLKYCPFCRGKLDYEYMDEIEEGDFDEWE